MTDTPTNHALQRPDSFDFALDFVGEPEAGELLAYVEALEARARTLLAQPEPEGLTDEQWGVLVERAWDKYETVGYQGERFIYNSDFGNALDFVRKELALWSHPTPQPPADGEVGELIAVLRDMQDCFDIASGMEGCGPFVARAADLLERFASPCYVLDADTGAIASLEAAGHGRIEAMPAERTVLVPVAVSERPWDRDGWSDEEGQCWMGDPGDGEFIPSWRLCRPDDAPNMKVSLPANALPLPEGNDN